LEPDTEISETEDENGIRRPFDLRNLYETVSDYVEDDKKNVGIGLRMKMVEEMTAIAEGQGYRNPEFVRRAIMFAMMNPAALRAVDEQEKYYKSLMQHNGWNGTYDND